MFETDEYFPFFIADIAEITFPPTAATWGPVAIEPFKAVCV